MWCSLNAPMLANTVGLPPEATCRTQSRTTGLPVMAVYQRWLRGMFLEVRGVGSAMTVGREGGKG